LENKGWPIYIDTIKVIYEESIKLKIAITEMNKSENIMKFAKSIENFLLKDSKHSEMMEDIKTIS